MLDRSVRSAVERRGGDYQFLFKDLVWPVRDITYGNLEGAAARSGANQGSIYSFRMNPDSLFTLRQNGFSVLSVANNHIGDWGAVAATETVENINLAGMESSGWGYATTSDALVITEKKGIKFGFLAFSEFNSGGSATETKKGILLATAPYFEPMIRDVSQQVDVLIVSLHAGTEYAPTQNAFQERIAKQAIDAGARIVMGHHPHVVQPVMEYNNGLIAYSLGNFIFDQSFSSETTEGGALLVTYNADKKTFTYKFGKTKQGPAFEVETIEWEPAEKTIHF
jgi:poly-gamma-glutamate synthesis protein (capsule biosynthesis protein)